MLRNGDTIAWLTPHAYVVRPKLRAEEYWMQLNASGRFDFNADGKRISALARYPEHLSEICDVVLRLLAASAVQSVNLGSPFDAACINAPSLAYLNSSAKV